MEMLRSARPSRTPEPEESTSLWLAARRGAGAAGAGALLIVLPTLLGWLASTQSTVSWLEAVAMGLSLWLLTWGAHLDASGVAVALAPLLATAAFAFIAVRSAVRVGQSGPEPGSGRGRTDRGRLLVLAAWAGGYAAAAAGAAAVSLLGPARPIAWSLLLPVLVVPMVCAAVALAWLVLRWGWEAPNPWRIPGLGVLARAWRPAVWGAGVMLAAGCLLVVVAAVAGSGEISALHAQLGAGLVGGTVISVGQLMILPNLGLWAVSFLAGPGFQVVDGAATTWTGSGGALLPLVPALGAMPRPGAFPGWLPVVVLVPVLVGVFIGWRAIAGLARLSGLLTKVCVVGVSAALAAVALGLLNVLAGGQVGEAALAHVGAPTLALTGMLFAEFAIGAFAVLCWDLWRVRR